MSCIHCMHVSDVFKAFLDKLAEAVDMRQI
ncbi:hypothetical protein P609_11755 [Comamonas thiooxydans]|nr:hypothetical protein P609_11755 [Comamonas thiooxydans]